MAKNASFIRWAGGKGWFIPVVQDMIQNLQFNNYIEPFMEVHLSFLRWIYLIKRICPI